VSDWRASVQAFPRERTWLLPSLHAVQHDLRWIPAEALADVAAHLRVPLSEAYGVATKTFAIDRPHHHLNMIGVRAEVAGTGLSRPLLEAVATMSRDDTGSCGVSLTTELAKNVTLYEHFGYRVVGHARVAPDLETWGMFLET